MGIEEMEARLAEKREARAKAEEAQYERDLEARMGLEDEHGTVAAVRVLFKAPHPTRAFLKTPTAAQYKRYVDQIGKAVEKKNQKSQREAQEMLARSCWVYPADEKDRDAMLEEFPGLLTSIAIVAASLAEGKSEDEGKG